MRGKVVFQFIAVLMVVFITWEITNPSFDVNKRAKDIMDYFANEEPTTPPPKIKCDLERDCPEHFFALSIKSGAANVVGPSICFEGKRIVSHIHNNVQTGMNIVVINGETGSVDKIGFPKEGGRPEDILDYLKKIEPGRIVLLASFDDMAPKLTDEIRNTLESMGSTLIKTLKSRDNWVFAGRPGSSLKSLFEKISVSDPKTNPYEGWPEVVEISGCFPKNAL